MGLLIDGIWHDQWYSTKETGGRFVRSDATLRNWITPDGAAGPTGSGGFPAENGRYHLYVAEACPWSHRAIIVRQLKKLHDIISMSVVSPIIGTDGWVFSKEQGGTSDHLFQYEYLRQVYTRSDPKYSGRVTVPVLWDKLQNTIVSNESSEIIRMFNSAFNHLGDTQLDLYPKALREKINEMNALIYPNINNAVYRAGFATTQEAYREAYEQLFGTLDKIDAILAKQRYLLGDQITEADWRLFVTLIRFDAVYVGHFKCNRQRISDYPNLSNYTRELYQVDGIAETVNFEQIKIGYYASHVTINPTRIVPNGPDLNYAAPHNRNELITFN